MNMPNHDPSYAICVIEPDAMSTYVDNGEELFETASAIKSAIGTLAIERAAHDAVDLETYTMTVQPDHYSNGSGILKELPLFRKATDIAPAPYSISLKNILDINIRESDCVATNLLIDYLGGAEEVNVQLRSVLGLETTTLVTDRIHFPGVDHTDVPFQVGTATMRDFAHYYQKIWSEHSPKQLMAPAHEWHRERHQFVAQAILFGIPQFELPEAVEWEHKTGSILDREVDSFYESVVDAGMLQIDGRTLFVAAASTVLRRGIMTGNERSAFENEFADRNEDVLEELSVVLPKQEAVA